LNLAYTLAANSSTHHITTYLQTTAGKLAIEAVCVAILASVHAS
jgi:hypothetical protein